jgi:outer membrane protease
MSKCLVPTVVLCLMSLTAFSAPIQSAASNSVTWNLWGGAGIMNGDVTYQIGGHYEDSTGEGETHFPLSELKWPVNVPFGTVGASVDFNRLEARGQFSKNLSSDAGQIEDSDWEDEADPDLLTTYSESDTDFEGYIADGSIRYWLLETSLREIRTSLAVGAGWLYEYFSWDAENLDQWEPQNPDSEHIIVPGTVGSYEATLNMPYVEAAGKLAFKGLTIEGSLGAAPYAQVHDVDDHKLRYILAKTDADGTAFKASLQARYNFTDKVFLMTQLSYLTFDVDGSEENEVYAGAYEGETWSIDHNVTSDQTHVLLAAGVNF